MIKILSNDFGCPIELFVANEAEYYSTVIKPIVDEIKAHIPEKLREVFLNLCIFRKFNASFLRFLIDSGLIEGSIDEFKLELLLMSTYLVSKSYGFLQDDTIRRLLYIELRKTSTEHLNRMYEQSIAFYESRLEKTYSPHIMVVEILFLKLNFLHNKQNCNKKEYFVSVAETLQSIATLTESREILQNVRSLLMDDWEYRFTLNFLLKEGVYTNDYPFNELIGIVDKSISNL